MGSKKCAWVVIRLSRVPRGFGCVVNSRVKRMMENEKKKKEVI